MRSAGIRLFALVIAFAGVPALGLAYEEQSLLTPDGTMHVVRTGTAVDLGATDLSFNAETNLIDWSSRAQDGTVTTGIIPGTVSYQEKRGLQLAYDEQTGKLIAMWTEDLSPYSQIRIGVLENGVWTNSSLLPTQGISRAYNPVMRITHQTVTQLDEHDVVVTSTASILSVIWWEEAQFVQARYAAVFLDENSADPSSMAVYDLPKLVGSDSHASYDDVPSGAYLYPSLQTDGFSGSLIASFADLHDKQEKVVRIEFPSDRGKPSEYGNLTWERRHIPWTTIGLSGPVARMAPVLALRTDDNGVGTSIGVGYRPTFYWLDGTGTALKFMRLDGTDWEPVRSISIDDTMTYEKARDLVVSMGQRN